MRLPLIIISAGVLICARPLSAQVPTPIIHKVINLSPATPSENWTIELPPKASAKLTVNVDLGSATSKYKIKSGPDPSIVSSTGNTVIWRKISGEPGESTFVFDIVNTATAANASTTAKVECVWEAKKGPGTGGPAAPDINGLAEALAILQLTGNCAWSFDRTMQIADGKEVITYRATHVNAQGEPLTTPFTKIEAVNLAPATAAWTISPSEGNSSLVGKVKSTTASTGMLRATYVEGGASKNSASETILRFSEINVNDTTDVKDDMVRKEQKIGTIAWRQWIPCTVMIPESGPGKTITSIGVTAESGTMKFSDAQAKPGDSNAGAANVVVTLDAQGQGKFWITGITQSTNKGDAKLQIRKNGATGDVLVTKEMTVFWFDGTIKAEASGNANDTAIALSADKKSYGVVLGNGIDITATASVVPTGLDHTVKQIADWQLGIMQNVTTTRTWRGKNTVNGVETKAKGVYQTTDRLDTLQPAPDIIMQISEIGGAQKFEATRPAISDTVDPPYMPADVQLQTHNGAWLKWYESDMQDTFTIWSGIIEVTNGSRGTVFIPIKQNNWKAHGNSSQQNQKAAPSTGDGAKPTKVPSTQRPTAVDHIGDPNNTTWSVENN